MVCPVKVNLLAQYRISTYAYSVAVSDLERRICARGGAGFIDLLKLARDTRRLSKAASDNLHKHVSEHGC
jgi:hypothetical protein